MLPWSRGLRKEFLPLFDPGRNGEPLLKPIAHRVLESLVGAGVTDATLVVRPRDLAFVQEYFTVDPAFLARHAHHRQRLTETRRFYDELRKLRIRFALQPHPLGFGDAVLRAEPYIGAEPFLIQASDGFIVEGSPGATHRAMWDLLTAERLDAVLLVRRVGDPRRYGVVEAKPLGRFRGRRRLRVERVTEKPPRPRSHWAATAVYAFSSRIFDALGSARSATSGRSELELTAGIQQLIDSGGEVNALVLEPSTAWRSVGSPNGYLKALLASRSRP